MSGYKMKNQTSVNVVVIVSPTGEVLHVSQMYPGETNDSRIARQDEVIRDLCSNPVFKDFRYNVFTRDGEKVEKTGAYLKADGGFGYDRRLVSTFRIVIESFTFTRFASGLGVYCCWFDILALPRRRRV